MNKNYLVVKAFVAFGYNYSDPKEFIRYICEKTGETALESYLIEKWKVLSNIYGCYAVMNYFFSELDTKLREALVEYACKVYYPKGFPSDKEGIKLLNGGEKSADEIAYDRYLSGEYSYEDYVAVCEIEECEPLPEK